MHVECQEESRCTNPIMGTALGTGCSKSGGQDIWLREMMELLDLGERNPNMGSLSGHTATMGQCDCCQQPTKHHLTNHLNAFVAKLAESKPVQPPKRELGTGAAKSSEGHELLGYNAGDPESTWPGRHMSSISGLACLSKCQRQS